MGFKLKGHALPGPFKKPNEALIEGAAATHAPGEAVPGALFGTIANSIGQVAGAYAGSDAAQAKKKKKDKEEALNTEKLENVKDGDDVISENSTVGFTGTPDDIDEFNKNLEFQMKTKRFNERT